MKHLIIVNPKAGKRDMTFEIIRKAALCFGIRGEEHKVLVSEYPGHSVELVRDYLNENPDEKIWIYACGGDGTMNEIVNGAIGFQNVAVTTYPIGTGNDFLKIFDKQELFLDFDAIANGETVEIDVIRCNDVYGINIFSVGFDARVAHGMLNYKNLPLVKGKGLYNLSVVTNLLKGIAQKFVIKTGNQNYKGSFTMAVFANARYYGGGYYAVPDAVTDDGKAEILLVEKVGIIKLLKLIGPYSQGYYRKFSVIKHISASEMAISSDKPFIINIDGETKPAKHAQISIMSRYIKFIVPCGVKMLPPETLE